MIAATIALLSSFYILPAFSLAHPSISCLSSSNPYTAPICFPRALDPITGITLGFVIPPVASTSSGSGNGHAVLPPDFIASAWTPLPYGFAGMGGSLNNSSTREAKSDAVFAGQLTADWWIGATDDVQQSSSVKTKNVTKSSDTPIVQIFQKSTTSNSLVPVSSPQDAGAVITISPLSQESYSSSGADQAFMLFRCRNCTIQTLPRGTSSGFKLVTTISSTPAISTEGVSTLPLDDVKIGIVDVIPSQVELGEYDRIVQALGLS